MESMPFSCNDDLPQKDLQMPNRLSDTYPWHPDRVIWRRQMSASEKKRSEKFVASLYEAAEFVPILKEALQWADAHGVEIFIDPQCNSGGYYWSGSGVVFVSGNRMLPDGTATPEAVGTAVHELRHVWHDFYGMIAPGMNMESFANGFMQLALYEADAEAHGKLAREQFHLHKLGQMVAENEARGQKSFVNGIDMAATIKNSYDVNKKALADPGQFLYRAFQSWYANDFYRRGYGTALMQAYASNLGVPNARKVDYNVLFNKKAHPKGAAGIDIHDRADVLRLGKGFVSGNYLRDESWGWMESVALNTYLAKRFFDPSKAKPDLLITEIEKRQKRIALHKKARNKAVPKGV